MNSWTCLPNFTAVCVGIQTTILKPNLIARSFSCWSLTASNCLCWGLFPLRKTNPIPVKHVKLCDLYFVSYHRIMDIRNLDRFISYLKHKGTPYNKLIYPEDWDSRIVRNICAYYWLVENICLGQDSYQIVNVGHYDVSKKKFCIQFLTYNGNQSCHTGFLVEHTEFSTVNFPNWYVTYKRKVLDKNIH